MHLLAKPTYYLLYALLLATLWLGILNAFVHGYDMYGLFWGARSLAKLSQR